VQTISQPETNRLPRRKDQNHIGQSLHTKEGWLHMYKAIFKENIDKIDGDIWKITQNRVLEDLKKVKEEYYHYERETEQVNGIEGRSRTKELNPSPIPGEQRDI
jgi:hypothetical protein